MEPRTPILTRYTNCPEISFWATRPDSAAVIADLYFLGRNTGQVGGTMGNIISQYRNIDFGDENQTLSLSNGTSEVIVDLL